MVGGQVERRPATISQLQYSREEIYLELFMLTVELIILP
jgi:hypothetical protein